MFPKVGIEQREMACAWHEDEREARWVVEVLTPDHEVSQRCAACDRCARDVFHGMRRQIPQAENGSFTVMRRLMASDAVLTFHDLGRSE